MLYETFMRVKHVKMTKHEMNPSRHRLHLLALISPSLAFVFIYFITDINPIYSASIAMAFGAFAAMLCRLDLIHKIVWGALFFLTLYFLFFMAFSLVYPGIVEQVWNLKAISGILILGVPLEELMFALTFGALWSSYYEHINWYKLMKSYPV